MSTVPSKSSVLAAVTGRPRASLPGVQPLEPKPDSPFAIGEDPAAAEFRGGDLDHLAEPRLSLSILPELAAAPRVGTLVERVRTACGELGIKATITLHF